MVFCYYNVMYYYFLDMATLFTYKVSVVKIKTCVLVAIRFGFDSKFTETSLGRDIESGGVSSEKNALETSKLREYKNNLDFEFLTYESNNPQ